VDKNTYTFYLFVCGLFNDAFNRSDYVASNDQMISKYCIGKDVEGTGHGLL
jgi:hypothetical protein